MGKKKKEILDKEFVPFRDGMRSDGYSDEAIKALWDILVPFADYAFNKAHTAGVRPGVVLDRLPQGQLPGRVHGRRCSPSVGDDKDKMALYLAECRRMGIQVLPPDVNTSAGPFTPVGKDIRFGLAAVRNVGANVVDAIMRCRARRRAPTPTSTTSCPRSTRSSATRRPSNR